MARSQIRLNAQQVNDFAVISAISPDQLQSALSALNDLRVPLVRISDLREILARVVGEDNARAMVRQLIGFAIGARREAFPPDVMDALTDALKVRDWSPDKRQAWDSIRPILWSLLSHSHIQYAAKAFDLAFDYTNLLSEARIITDLRPVYDEDHTKLIGAVVRHVMRLTYYSVDGQTSLTIALDRKEIENIKSSCDEAIKKEDALRAYLSVPEPLPSITAGEERDELR
jgi:hypothetical protein